MEVAGYTKTRILKKYIIEAKRKQSLPSCEATKNKLSLTNMDMNLFYSNRGEKYAHRDPQKYELKMRKYAEICDKICTENAFGTWKISV